MRRPTIKNLPADTYTSTFSPELWSKKLLAKFYEETVLKAIEDEVERPSREQ